MSEERPREGRVILVIEDNEVIVELMQRSLERAGYRIMGCTHSSSYRQACLECSPDLIILDILMPEKSGWEVLRELKADPALSRIPVIVSSVKGRPEDVERAFREGASDYIAKPYVFADLLEKISRALEGGGT